METNEHYRVNRVPADERKRSMRGTVSRKNLLALLGSAGESPMSDEELEGFSYK